MWEREKQYVGALIQFVPIELRRETPNDLGPKGSEFEK